MSRGAVAAGSPLTVEAGLNALRAGGNAVDAAVASTLMACVAEPMLTGLGGGGLAILRMNGKVEVCDLFSEMPGRGEPDSPARPMRAVKLDFGPTTQTFHVGPGAVAVPGVPAGLHALHTRYGRVPMHILAEPAARAAEDGIPVSEGFERVCALLWPIQQLDPTSARLFGPRGRPLRQGETFRCPELGQTIRRFAEQGPGLFADGAVGQGILSVLGAKSKLSLQDLRQYTPRFIQPLRYRYRDATVWVPPPPSVAGLLVLQALRALEDHGPMPPPLGAPQVRFLAHAMERAEAVRKKSLHQNLFRPGFVDGFLAAIAPEETGEERAHSGGRRPRQPGNTTHISTVDEDGNAVGITHSLGETCGVVVPGTGVLLNNFLGEGDVNPDDANLTVGDRLMTMCCPTLLEMGDQVYVMGSGGSSRIRSAVLHGVVYLTDHGMSPEEVVSAPRAHVEFDTLHVESRGRPPGTLEALAVANPNMKRFDGSNMFFGGLHIAGAGPHGFEGAGDRRRSGAFGST